LSPGGLDATFELDLEVLHRGVRTLVCACDPALRPREVVAPHLDTWEVRPGPTPTSPSLLTLRLLEPVREGVVQVTCLAPLGAPGTGWAPAQRGGGRATPDPGGRWGGSSRGCGRYSTPPSGCPTAGGGSRVPGSPAGLVGRWVPGHVAHAPDQLSGEPRPALSA